MKIYGCEIPVDVNDGICRDFIVGPFVAKEDADKFTELFNHFYDNKSSQDTLWDIIDAFDSYKTYMRDGYIDGNAKTICVNVYEKDELKNILTKDGFDDIIQGMIKIREEEKRSDYRRLHKRDELIAEAHRRIEDTLKNEARVKGICSVDFSVEVCYKLHKEDLDRKLIFHVKGSGTTSVDPNTVCEKSVIRGDDIERDDDTISFINYIDTDIIRLIEKSVYFYIRCPYVGPRLRTLWEMYGRIAFDIINFLFYKNHKDIKFIDMNIIKGGYVS